MAMSENQSYEVQVHQNGRWQLHARYPHHERADAISEAKQLSETNERYAIRVIMEDYHPETGQHDEVLVYRNRAETTKAQAPKRAHVNWSDMAVSSDGRVGFLPDKHDDFDHVFDFEEKVRKKRKVSTLQFMFIVLVIIGTGFIAGAISAGLLFLMIIGFGANLSPSAIKSFVMGIFLLVGFIGCMSSLNHYRVHYDLNPFSQKRRPTPKVKKSKISKQMEKAAEAIDRAPPPKDIPESANEPENIFEREDVPPPVEETPVQNSDGTTFSSQAKQQQMFLVNFLGAVMSALKGPEAKIESLNRFALNLFLTGAIVRITQDHALDDEEEYTILCHVLEMLGAKREQVERFAMEYEKFLIDKRHSDLFVKAGEIVHAYRDGDPLVNVAIREAIETWVNHRKFEEHKNPNQLCVFFTDMVGSTDLTTRHGDYAAQEVLKAHDLIVRTALTNLDGQEIKHLGDGIMASFKDTDNALNAAIEILKRVEGNNNAGPEFPLHIRIGINIGEPIQKNNDLFGNVVQLASRLCAVAETDGVAVSKFLVEECGEKTPYTFHYQGQKPLKGFEQPMDIYHLDWSAEPRTFDEDSETSENDETENPNDRKQEDLEEGNLEVTPDKLELQDLDETPEPLTPDSTETIPTEPKPDPDAFNEGLYHQVEKN